MAVRVGINGFGRIGRLALRAAWEFPELEFVHINEVKGGVEAAGLCQSHGRTRAESYHSSYLKTNWTLLI